MRHARRTRWGLAFVACFALLVAACSGDEDQDGAIREIEAAEEEAEPEADVEPEPEEPDEPEPEPEETEPEPEPEPDQSEDEGITRAGIHVPADAYEINQDLDLDEEQQRFFLDFVIDALLYTTEALDTGVWDEDELAVFYAADELEQNIAGFERYERDGLRQITAGMVVEFIRVGVFDGGGVIVHMCTTDGPDDGVIKIETGEYTFRPENPHRSLATELALVEVAEDKVDYRIVGGGGVDIACPA